MKKTCTKCKAVKEAPMDFARHTTNKDGFHSWCKKCVRQGQQRKPVTEGMFDVDAYFATEIFPPGYKEHERIHHIPIHKIRISKRA